MDSIMICGSLGLIALGMVFGFYLVHRSQVLIDRLTDKIMAERNPSSFVAYGTTTPTIKEEEFRTKMPTPTSKNGNGYHDELPSYLEVE